MCVKNAIDEIQDQNKARNYCEIECFVDLHIYSNGKSICVCLNYSKQKR